MAKTSPTQRTLARLKKEDYDLVAITERWNPFAKNKARPLWVHRYISYQRW